MRQYKYGFSDHDKCYKINKGLKRVRMYKGAWIGVLLLLCSWIIWWLECRGQGLAGSSGLHVINVNRDKGLRLILLISRQIVGEEMRVSVGEQRRRILLWALKSWVPLPHLGEGNLLWSSWHLGSHASFWGCGGWTGLEDSSVYHILFNGIIDFL